MKSEITTVDQYLSLCDPAIASTLSTLRDTIKKAAPKALEKISWGTPTYHLNGFLVQFAAYKNHIGFYCSPGAIAHFSKELKNYKTNSKNTIQFPLDRELPWELIAQLVEFRSKENSGEH